MGELFNITHDADNLDEYDGATTDGGDLHTGTPGLVGTAAKMICLLDDTNELRAYISVAAVPQIRFRFYIDPNTITMADGDSFVVHHIYPGNWLERVNLEYTDADGYILSLDAFNDAVAIVFDDDKIISDDVHYVEIHVVRATNAESNDGTIQWWVDGEDQGSFNTIDNYNRMFDDPLSFRLGARFVDAGTANSEEFFLDEFKCNDDGSEIGPVAAAGNPYYAYAQQ